MDVPLVGSPEVAATPLSEYQAELRTDASYSYDDHVTGAAWQLVVNGVEGPIQDAGRRFGKGPVHAEMTAIGLGLEDARQHGMCLWSSRPIASGVRRRSWER